MSAIQNFLLLHVFTALLPPAKGDGTTTDENGNIVSYNGQDDHDTRDYYEILGLKKKRRATYQEIRKAYKTKSLQLHPDKIAQRGSRYTTQEIDEMKREYLKVQEAYACLEHADHRKQYHQLGMSRSRYQFVVLQHGLYHPSMVVSNIARSSCLDKTRLITLLTCIFVGCLIQPILIASKINQILRSNENKDANDANDNDDGLLVDAPWTLVLIPLWCFQILLILAFGGIFSVVVCKRDDNSSSNSSLWIPLLLLLLEHMAWFVGNFMLAVRWDSNNNSSTTATTGTGISSWNWHLISIPYYVALLLRIMGAVATARQAKYTQSQMVTPERMEQIIKEEKENNNNENNQNDASAGVDATVDDDVDGGNKVASSLENQYHVITVDEEAVASMLHMMRMAEEEDVEHASLPPLDEEEIEMLKVTMSPEYEAAEKMIQQQTYVIGNVIVFGITFVALVSCQLQGQINVASWWIIFIPILLYFGYQILYSFYTCCCVSVSSEPIIILPDHNSDSGSGSTSNKGKINHNANSKNSNNKEGGEHDNSSKNDGDGGVKLSMNFASTEGSMDEFNDHDDGRNENGNRLASSSGVNFAPVEGSMNAPTIATSTNDRQSKDHTNQEGTSGVHGNVSVGDKEAQKDYIEVLDNTTAVAHGRDTTQQQQDKDKATSSEERKGGDGDKNDEDGEVDDEENPYDHIDPETFRAWQKAYEEAETTAMERQAKAQMNCCWATFQLIIVCLIVGKLEQDYSLTDETDDSIGYNTFWILFPIFFVMGILLCCCCCLVYSAGASSLDDVLERAEQRASSTTTANDGEHNDAHDTENNDAVKQQQQQHQHQQAGTNSETGPIPVGVSNGATIPLSDSVIRKEESSAVTASDKQQQQQQQQQTTISDGDKQEHDVEEGGGDINDLD